MDRTFTLAEAEGLMPALLARTDELVEIRASLVEVQAALAGGEPSPLGGLPEMKAYQARLSELLGWFSDEGLELKGIAPLLLCWLEGERELGWYHKLPHGFAGRRRLGSASS
jgi:hypothetical protein